MAVMERIGDRALGAWCRWEARVATREGEDGEEGSTTVEYAIGAVAAAGFAGLLLVVLKSGAMRTAIQGIIERALTL